MIFKRISFIFFLILLVLLIKGTLPYEHNGSPQNSNVITLSKFTYDLNGIKSDITLPHSLQDLPPKTPVVFYAEITPQDGDCLYIKSVYAEVRLYADDNLIYEAGKSGSFPELLIDPPTLLSIVKVPHSAKGIMKLRLEYTSPSQRNVLTVHPILIGTSSDLFNYISSQYMFSFLLSITLIFFGIVAIFTSITLLRIDENLSALLWLGVFSFFTGLWVFGECNLTALLIPYPSLLYIFAFIGLFSLNIPLFKFGLISLNLHNKKIVKSILLIMQVTLLSAMILQLFGIVSFSRTMYLFHIITPLFLAIFSICIIWDALHFNNLMARRFLFPMSVIAVAAALELLNYQLRFTHNMSFFFQLGAVLFVILLGGVGGYFIRDAIRIKEDKRRLEFDLTLKEQQIDMQKLQYSLLMQNSAAIKAQRHDLRHQLTVIKYFNDTSDGEKLNKYLTELIAKIPTDKDISLCENSAVNAVTLYYVTIAKSEGINVTTQLNIPSSLGCIQDSDVCVIVGNFLENALEACRLMQGGEKFIKLYSQIRYDMLIITMDNSFSGKYTKQGDVFLSQKRTNSSVGVGLSSVQTVAEKYNGSAKFETKDNVFCSSLYIQLQEQNL